MHRQIEVVLLALGSFWEAEYQFSKIDGVIHVEAGYTGGTSATPTYHNIGDHVEAIKIEFDPRVISYEQLLTKFWKWHDPTAQYENRFRSAIFYLDESQREQAEASKLAAQERFNAPIVTEVLPAGRFYAAEPFNQDYIAKLRGEI